MHTIYVINRNYVYLHLQYILTMSGAFGRRSPTHPPTHTLEQNIDTLSALVQRIPIPYFMSGSNSLKRGKEEPNKATSFQHHHGNVHLKMQIRWIDQIQYPISLVASLDTVPVTC